MNHARVVRKLLLGTHFLAATMLSGCALPLTMQTSQVSVWARSHNRSAMDVYLLCGDRDAQWLGVVGPKEAAALDFPYARTRCARGLNFFLVSRDVNHGYWVGPMYPRAGSRIDLVIEKYAGLSSANLSRE
jgi:hypothetical protein